MPIHFFAQVYFELMERNFFFYSSYVLRSAINQIMSWKKWNNTKKSLSWTLNWILEFVTHTYSMPFLGSNFLESYFFFWLTWLERVCFEGRAKMAKSGFFLKCEIWSALISCHIKIFSPVSYFYFMSAHNQAVPSATIEVCLFGIAEEGQSAWLRVWVPTGDEYNWNSLKGFHFEVQLLWNATQKGTFRRFLKRNPSLCHKDGPW